MSKPAEFHVHAPSPFFMIAQMSANPRISALLARADAVCAAARSLAGERKQVFASLAQTQAQWQHSRTEMRRMVRTLQTAAAKWKLR